MAGIGLTLSGGGFRATLFHLGVVAFLRDEGVLSEVRHLCTVSGGSILGAHLVLHWENYNGTLEEFQREASKVIAFTKSGVRERLVRKWLLALMTIVGRLYPPGTRAWSRVNLWQHELASLYGEAMMKDLEQSSHLPKKPAIELLSTSMLTGRMCYFSPSRFHHDPPSEKGKNLVYENIWVKTFRIGEKIREFVERGLSAKMRAVVYPCVERGIRVSFAVAASSAFPPFFPPLRLRGSGLGVNDNEWLTDGGVYENLGIRRMQQLHKDPNVNHDAVLVSDASGLFYLIPESPWGFITSRIVRATDILMKRIADLESERTEGLSTAKKFISCPIDASVSGSRLGDAEPLVPRIRTDLNAFSNEEVYALLWHGYETAREVWERRAPEGLKTGRAKGEALYFLGKIDTKRLADRMQQSHRLRLLW